MSAVDVAAAETTAAPVKKRKKLLLIVAVVVLALAGGGWWFMIRPASAAEKPTPGEVLQLEPIQVNLAGGHYLKIGIALQAVKGAEDVESSKALDATIELFSGETVQHLADAHRRAELKRALAEELDHRYHGEVMEVYFTDFVTQ